MGLNGTTLALMSEVVRLAHRLETVLATQPGGVAEQMVRDDLRRQLRALYQARTEAEPA